MAESHSSEYENTPQFMVMVGDDVYSAFSEPDLMDVLNEHVRPSRKATVYKLDGDAVYKDTRVQFFPLGFE